MAGGALFFLLDLLPFWVEYFSSVQVLVDSVDACLSTSLIVMCYMDVVVQFRPWRFKNC